MVFKNLSREDTTAIAKLQLKSLAKNLEEQELNFRAMKKWFVNSGTRLRPGFWRSAFARSDFGKNPQRFGGKNFKKRNQQRRFN